MSTRTACLTDYVRTVNDDLAARLEAARQMHGRRDDPRLQRARIDSFLGATCKHLHVMDDVLLPAYGRLPDGRGLCHDYVAAVKRLEVLLYHVHAHEYGSTYESTYAWPTVWAEVARTMADQRRNEERMAQRLTEALDDEALTALTDRIASLEPAEPSRPHPHQPHGGLLGRVSRTVMRATDGFWDMAQGRIVPEPPRPPRKEPGLLGQYLLGSPRLDRTDRRPE